MRRPFALMIAGLLSVTPLWAQTPLVDGPVFQDALTALDNEDSETALTLVTGTDPVTRDLVRWALHRDGQGTFDEMVDFLNDRPNWPGLDRIRAQSERQLFQDDDQTTVQDQLSFFDGADVQTGEGAVVYANALIDAGLRDQAHAIIVDLWRNQALDENGHKAVVNAYGDVVAPHHVARADMLLWRWRTSDAELVIPLLDEGHQALVRARIALITKANDASVRIDAVPDRFLGDAGLQYDRFNRLADAGDWTDGTAILVDRSTSAEALGVAWRWGSWRRILARWHMREGNIDRAYGLASNHFIAPEQTNYSDLEWLSGYIALTYLDDAAKALAHFDAFAASVSSPISLGRAGYWQGRAYDKLGNEDAAIAAYLAGAQHQTSFYGLLSAEMLGLTLNPDIAGGENYSDWPTAPVINHDLVRAGLTLLNAGERGLAVLFFRDVAQTLSRREIGQLGAMFMELDEPFYAVLIAKTAVRRDVLVQDVYFPLHPMAVLDLPVEPALALAIARQESEFRTDAGSSVGALGLMQLMPATAQEVTGWLDLPYSRGRLTTDWRYNAALGSEYLAYLTREFGNSPVMIAAGYNAGPSRPKAWMTDRGDPRAGFGNDTPVDVIDWIEHIPFRETRNYVMRVTEGIPVYSARLSGGVGPVRFTDILVGAQPVIRPVARPIRQAAAQDGETAQDSETDPIRPLSTPSAPGRPQLIRPVARAGGE